MLKSPGKKTYAHSNSTRPESSPTPTRPTLQPSGRYRRSPKQGPTPESVATHLILTFGDELVMFPAALAKFGPKTRTLKALTGLT